MCAILWQLGSCNYHKNYSSTSSADKLSRNKTLECGKSDKCQLPLYLATEAHARWILWQYQIYSANEINPLACQRLYQSSVSVGTFAFTIGQVLPEVEEDVMIYVGVNTPEIAEELFLEAKGAGKKFWLFSLIFTLHGDHFWPTKQIYISPYSLLLQHYACYRWYYC